MCRIRQYFHALQRLGRRLRTVDYYKCTDGGTPRRLRDAVIDFGNSLKNLKKSMSSTAYNNDNEALKAR